MLKAFQAAFAGNDPDPIQNETQQWFNNIMPKRGVKFNIDKFLANYERVDENRLDWNQRQEFRDILAKAGAARRQMYNQFLNTKRQNPQAFPPSQEKFLRHYVADIWDDNVSPDVIIPKRGPRIYVRRAGGRYRKRHTRSNRTKKKRRSTNHRRSRRCTCRRK